MRPSESIEPETSDPRWTNVCSKKRLGETFRTLEEHQNLHSCGAHFCLLILPKHQKQVFVNPQKPRNTMVARCCICIFICCILKTPFVLEQPGSSLLEWHPLFQVLCKRFCIYRAPQPNSDAALYFRWHEGSMDNLNVGHHTSFQPPRYFFGWAHTAVEVPCQYKRVWAGRWVWIAHNFNWALISFKVEV